MLLEGLQAMNNALNIMPIEQAIEMLEREGFTVSNPAIIDFMREQGQAAIAEDETPVMQPDPASQALLEGADE